MMRESGSVLIATSQQNLRELLDGYPARKTVLVDGTLHQTYPVGSRPARYADEHPVFEGHMLRPSGISDQHVEWGAIDFKVRQLVRLATVTGELQAKKLTDDRDAFEEVQGKTFDEICSRWTQAAIKFKEQEGSGSLPALKVVLGKKKAAESK